MSPVKIGTSETDFWLYSPEEGYDVSRGVEPELCKSLATNKGQLKIAPKLSALIVIDMQNIFLHPDVKSHEPGLRAIPHIEKAVLASRKAGVKVLWVNWGLTEEEVATMPPGLAAGFTAPMPPKLGRPKFYGVDMETRVDGVEAGKLLMRDQWNTRLYGPLEAMWKEGEKMGTDVWIDKNRLGAMNTHDTDLGKYLIANGLKTLFFTGVNTNNCVSGTFNDCHAKGFDCSLIKDGTGTTTSEEAQRVTEFVCEMYGFGTTSKEYCKGLEA